MEARIYRTMEGNADTSAEFLLLCDEDPLGEAGPISTSSFAKSSFQVSLSSTAVLLTWMMGGACLEEFQLYKSTGNELIIESFEFFA
ncbi:unnamed protein product [Cylicocyclus nassatus]|uniref:Uncharacterized protein n=1 Tax=Cylicocyclus nassatus TaxID=53992 RepID=A0AA36MDB0_CYLNA|nr:unnamed protein product [Cylicocyclus nassatus]